MVSLLVTTGLIAVPLRQALKRFYDINITLTRLATRVPRPVST